MRQLGAGEIRALWPGAGGKQELGIREYFAVVECHLRAVGSMRAIFMASLHTPSGMSAMLTPAARSGPRSAASLKASS
jgi:hypothetical protein